MAKLPGIADLGPTPRADPGTPVASTAGGGEALAAGGRALGAGISKGAEGVGELALDESRWDYAKAHSDFLVRKVNLDEQTKQDTNYGPDESGKNLPDRYRAGVEKLRDDAADSIRSSPMRERFVMDTAPTIEHGVATAFAHARAKELNAYTAYVLESGKATTDSVVRVDDQTARKLADGHNGLIDGLVDEGAISPTQAVAMKQTWAHDTTAAIVLKIADSGDGEKIRKTAEALQAGEGIFGRLPTATRLELSARLRSAMQGEQFAVKDLIGDDVASVLNTGQGMPNLTPERIAGAFGNKGTSAVAEWQNAREDAQKIWGTSHNFSSLTDSEMYDRVEEMQPKPGAPGYARQQAVYAEVVKRADDTYKVRREDPAKAVQSDPDVQAARAGVNQAQPETFQALAGARMAAQTKLGIPPESQSPLTKDEALRLTVPLRSMLPGQERGVVTDMAKQFQQMFGEHAGTAFEYALRVHKVDNTTASAAASVMRKLGLGGVPGPDVTTGADRAGEVGAADQAVGVEREAAQSAREAAAARTAASMRRRPGSQSIPMMQEGPIEPPAGVAIPRRAIEFLRKNPNTADKFDVEFGSGASKKILDRYQVQ